MKTLESKFLHWCISLVWDINTSLRKYEGVIDDDTNILVDVLCDAINRINATSLTTTDVQKIVNALKAMLENDDLGREFYSVLINGYNGLKLIDFEDFGGTVNSYHVVTEMTCKNGSDEFRPDITPLINGIPLAFIEVKSLTTRAASRPNMIVC